MDTLRHVSIDEVVEAFQHDQKVRETGKSWPDIPFERISLLREAKRPVNNLLRLVWTRCRLSKEDLFAKVRPVWVPNFAMSFGEMIQAIKAGTFSIPTPNSVQRLQDEMKKTFRANEFLLIGYLHDSETILLEDGHNRLTAAALAEVLPETVEMYLGC